MENRDYKMVNGIECPGIYESQTSIAWPEFMLHDPVSDACWEDLFTYFPEYQLALLEGDDIIGYASSIPLSLDPEKMELDERGWDWALEKGFEDSKAGGEATVLCGLQIGINPQCKGKGISSVLIEGMRNVAMQKGYKALVLPVRPTLKHKYPLVDMEDYITWKDRNNLPFDPWMRAHVKFGARIVKVCPRAMYIPGTLAEWEAWTGLSFQTSGKYIVEGALAPVEVSLEKKRAEYTEPNVWMVHHLRG